MPFSMKIQIFAIVALLELSACKDKEAPVLSITNPVEGTSYPKSTPLSITGKCTDHSMHEMTLTLTDDSTNDVLFTYSPTVHDKSSFDISTVWQTPSDSKSGRVTLNCECVDHEDNQAVKTIHFKVQ